jgi:hypothetical protein
VFENPAERLGGVAVVWLQDHNCIVLKNPAGTFGGFAVVSVQAENCNCVVIVLLLCYKLNHAWR